MRMSNQWDVSSSLARSRNCERASVNIATIPAMNSVGTIHVYGASCRRRQIPFHLYQSGPSSFVAVFGTVRLSMNKLLKRHAARNPSESDLMPNGSLVMQPEKHWVSPTGP